MSSIEIAEISGKPHYDLMKAIRRMEPSWEKVTRKKFLLTDYEHATSGTGKKKSPMYQLTKEETLYIATKFNDEARARLILRWLELEKGQKPTLQLPESFGSYPEETVIAVRMGEHSNHVYIINGVVFAKFTPIAQYIGYMSAPTYYLPRFGEGNSIKITIGKQDVWFINAVALSELLKLRADVPFGKIKTLYKDLFGIVTEQDKENPYTYHFTDSEMLEIFIHLSKRPFSRGIVSDLLTKGKKGGN